MTYCWELTKEDSLYEYTSTLLFLLTAIAFFILATNPKYYVAFKKTINLPERKYFLLIAFVLFFTTGEEISWGSVNFQF